MDKKKVTEWKNDAFTVQPAENGISGLWKTGDRYATNYIRKGRIFGDVIVKGDTAGLSLGQHWELEKTRLCWTIELQNKGDKALTIEDLALPLPYNSGGGENPREIFEQHVVKHHFISGNNSFIFWERPTGVGPYLVMLPAQGASFEYFETGTGENRGAFQAYIHSAHAAGKAAGAWNGDSLATSWRQPSTHLTLAPGQQQRYQFVFRWANDYQQIRDLIVEEGGIDIRSTPGMTIPNDLDATIALRTTQTINAIEPEFPAATSISALAQRQANTRLYKIHFTRPGENRLTITYGNNKHTVLEFFVTEPLETLYKKRAAFIVDRQQHKDPSKWYDGLFSVYDMKHHVLRGPDNPDYFDTSRLSYVLTCDDPALDKAPFVAAKNLYYPNQHEIDALEYYIKHFVWGKLQRTDQETPYPYGVYGTPNWRVNRDTALRKLNVNDRNKDKMHVWRSYDYPHIVMLYYHLYQIARRYPKMTHYLDAKGYLIRAKETAKAFFLYPYEILPWYETYKWGCYNELLLVPLMQTLEREGFAKDADFLRREWEKKVKYFLYDDPYPFRSEYAIDATAFESTQALAAYAVHHTLQPDSNLWFDKNLKRWYSHAHIDLTDAKNFMDRQIEANIALRGSIEPAYYYLGSDYRGRSDNFTLTYMTQMGGWSILDYALHYSADPAEYLRLGYAAYLAPFALMNTGTAATNYGFWYPGKDNDGASGWAFESQQHTNTWIQKPQGRGPWYYDGEVDLGYGGATRTAATILTDDPIFGWIAYGGTLSVQGKQMSVVPRDGLRTRFFYRPDTSSRANSSGRANSVKTDGFDLELDRDGFAKDQPILVDTATGAIEFTIENRSGDVHTTRISLKRGDEIKNIDLTIKLKSVKYRSIGK